MEHFEEILDDCLQQMAGGVPLEECLRQHPAEAAELKPLLLAAAKLERGRGLQPSPDYRRATRSGLVRHMWANPRLQVPRAGFAPRPVWRVAIGVMVLVIALMISGTAYAQRAVPGDSLYGWKITSEQAWRAISQDRVGIDLILAERRVSEYKLVAGDPDRGTRALAGYGEVLVRLESETNDQTRGRILPVLAGHAYSLKDSGIIIPELDDYLVNQDGKGDSKLPGKKIDPPSLKVDSTPVVPPPK